MLRKPAPILPALVVVAVVLGLLGGVAPSYAAAGGPLRVLLEGDSITQGFHGDYTWRYRLDKEFARQGVPVDFVGSLRNPHVSPGWTTASYADPNFDRDHFARAGATLAQHANWVHAEVLAQKPDLVVLMVGVNDLRHGATPEQTDTNLRKWIRAARTADPGLRIVVSSVLDARGTRKDLSSAIRRYNALAHATVSSFSSRQSPITWADTTRGWALSAHTAEDLHPTPTGDSLIAQRIGETLHGLGVLRMSPDSYRWTPWDRRPRVSVVLKGRRAVLSWDHEAIWSARVWVQRRGRAASFSTYRYAGGTMTTSPLVPGTYDFRVQLHRGRMATPLGPATRLVLTAARRPAPASRVSISARTVRWTPSARASSYVVKLRRARHQRWVTRRTSGLSIAAANVVRARVWAVNSAGRSAVRAARR